MKLKTVKQLYLSTGNSAAGQVSLSAYVGSSQNLEDLKRDGCSVVTEDFSPRGLFYMRREGVGSPNPAPSRAWGRGGARLALWDGLTTGGSMDGKG